MPIGARSVIQLANDRFVITDHDRLLIFNSEGEEPIFINQGPRQRIASIISLNNGNILIEVLLYDRIKSFIEYTSSSGE